MAPIGGCLGLMARLSLVRPGTVTIPRLFAPALLQCRQASRMVKKKSKKRTYSKEFRRADLSKSSLPRFSLCAAMHILRAVEVGSEPIGTKYELHINMKAVRNGPVIKDAMRLPHPVKSDWKYGVICPDDSREAKEALTAGAIIVGQENIFEQIREEKFTFDRLLCLEGECENALKKAGVARILGPRGLMPSKKLKTIVTNPAQAIIESSGSIVIRERDGIINIPIGQLNYTPEQLKDNVHAAVKKIKDECVIMSDQIPKDVHEVILSTTHGPGLSLSGVFRTVGDVEPEALRGPM